jgi:hypothetical protein
VHLNPPRVGEILAGAFGALLLVSLFLPWYRSSAACVRAPCPQPDATAFESFAGLDVFLVVVALGGVGLLALEATQPTPAVPVAWASVGALLGFVAVVLVLWRMLAPPAIGPDDPVFAALGLAASAGVTAGCFLSMRNESPRHRPASRPPARRGSRSTEPIAVLDKTGDR